MRNMRLVLMVVLLAMLAALPFAATANAQVLVGVGLGPVLVDAPVVYGPPVCDWGYYLYYPYDCAPYGYYGPDWFYGGVFIGVGPWYGWGHGGYGYRGGYGGPRAFAARGAYSGGAGGVRSFSNSAPGLSGSSRGYSGTARSLSGSGVRSGSVSSSRGFSSGGARGGFSGGGFSGGGRGGGGGGGGHR
jgi:hypothetical protein